MPITVVEAPHVLSAAGSPPKTISEFVGRLATADDGVSIAVMDSPQGWSEPGQCPEFDEFSVVLQGELQVECAEGTVVVGEGQAVRVPAGEWVRYSTPGAQGARYVAVCLPAFSPERVHRDVS